MSSNEDQGRRDDRPNVLFIIADQLRADHLAYAGNAAVKTPNIDRLARMSAVFEQATVTNPTCMPNRASLMTGRWPSVHGTRFNGIPMDPEANNMVRSMRQSGYRTLAVGKLHHQNMGWEFEEDQAAQIAATDPTLLNKNYPNACSYHRRVGWDLWENREAHNQRYIQLPDDYYGYDTVDLVVGHGDQPGGHYVHWARQQGMDPLRSGGPSTARNKYSAWSQVYETAIPAHLHPSSYVGDRAVEHLHSLADQPDPFFMFVSFPDPHHPFAPPAGYADMYNPAMVDLPVGFHQDHAKSPPHVRRMIEHRGEPNHDPTMTWAATEEQYRHAVAAQYGLITLMDEQVGRLLEALETHDLLEDTVIVFTSDHGDLFGDHGLMLKHFSHYRAVTRVPLMIKLSAGVEAHSMRNEALVSTADLAPTLLELTRTGAYRGIQGKSLLPLLTGQTDTLRSALLIEEDQPFGLPGLPAPVRMRTVITDQGRLTRYFGTGIIELYDFATDPDELNNVADQPEYSELQNGLTEAMLEQMAALMDMGTAPTASA
ncbi:sulfatase family protein [Arthrobacter pigmenti]